MTKRKIKSRGPTGPNKSLGNGLVNTQKALSKKQPNPNIVKEDAPTKVVDSVTHETNLIEFLANAELAGTNFEAERGDIRVLSKAESSIVKFEDLKSRPLDELNRNYGYLLRIPRRPHRSLYTTADELNAIEVETFLVWKRNLCLLSEGSDVVLTPFERNLELWRQLWRVIERSDLVVQIVDARNPLMFRSADLEAYVREVDPLKGSLILVNKADLLTREQIHEWHNYFEKQGISAIFCGEEFEDFDDLVSGVKAWIDSKDEDFFKQGIDLLPEKWSATQSAQNAENVADEKGGDLHDSVPQLLTTDDNHSANEQSTSSDSFTFIESARGLLEHLKERARAAQPDRNAFVVGMVGYPNVGKSSTINCLVGAKRISVSATPGKTKHFQTIVIDEELTLCDCPGLVMPSFGFSNSQMILNCVLPIHNMRDYFSPIQLLCTRVPRRQFEALYSVLLPRSAAHERGDRAPTAHELLTTVAFMKGFMASAGVPDCSRSARLILRDVVDGRLKWVASPPGVSQATFDEWTYRRVGDESAQRRKPHSEYGENLLKQLDKRNLLNNDESTNLRVDRAFFDAKTAGARFRGTGGGVQSASVSAAADSLLASKKHGNRNKREKTRRLFAHLDA